MSQWLHELNVDPEKFGNWLEAGLWICCSLAVLVKAFRDPIRFRPTFFKLAATLFVFGLSDVVESFTGAWWRPWWLLVWKTVCVLFLFLCFRAYYRIKRGAA